MPSEELALSLLVAVGPPPLHPMCRCSLAPDGEWVDAGDARVCPRCMLAGATWNLHLDLPLAPEESKALLDETDLDSYRRTLRTDHSGLVDSVIRESIASATGGVVKEIFFPLGTSARNIIERELVARVADERAVTTEARGTKVAYRFISVLVAENAAGEVVRRNGRYLVRHLGRVLFAEDDLAMALLLLALLLKKRESKNAPRPHRVPEERAGP